MTTSESKTRSAADTVREAGKESAETLRDTVHDAAGKVSAEATGAMEKARTGAAQEVKDLADALRTAAGELDDGSPQRRMIGTVARNLEQVSDALHDRSIGDMLGQMNGLAKRNPMLFLGGAALLGFAATRLAVASAPDGAATSRSATQGAGTGGYSARDDATTRGTSATSRGV